MSPEQKSLIKESFLRDAELAFIEATRSTLLQPRTHIPTWLVVLLIVLGWNEFMAILGSPFYFLITLILVGALFICGYFPAFGSLIPAAASISNLLASKMLEFMQHFASQEQHNSQGNGHFPRKKSILSPSTTSSSSRFDTHRPVFGGSRSTSTQGFSPEMALRDTDLHSDDGPNEDEYADGERIPLLSAMSKK